MKIAIVATSLLLATAIPATAGHYGGDGGTNWGAVAGAGILGALLGAAAAPQQQPPHDCGPDDGNGQVRDDRGGPNDTPFGIPRAVSLDGRSLGPHHGATHPRADPGQKQDPAKVTTCVPTPSKYPRCWCRGSAPSR